MGTIRPKITGVESELYAEIENDIKDAIITEKTDDSVLVFLIEMTVSSIRSKRPLFSSIIDEPFFYRLYFKQWVEEGLAEAAEMKRLHEKGKNDA